MSRNADLANRFLFTWLDRQDTEDRLVTECEEFFNLLALAYDGRHEIRGLPSEHLQWARRVGLTSPEEDAVIRNAMVLRNHIVLKQFDIVLRDINRHANRVQPILDALPARIAELEGPDHSNVRYLR